MSVGFARELTTAAVATTGQGQVRVSAEEAFVVDAVLTLIQDCARQVGEQEEITLPSDLGAETRLFGQRGLFDSVGLVSLVVVVEEAIEDQYGVSVSLADERAMSQERSPFRSVGSLAEYAAQLIESAR